MRRAVIELAIDEGGEKANDPGRGIAGEVGIGDVALHAADDESAGERAAAADLEGVAQRVRICRLAEQAMAEALATRLGPIEKLAGSVDRRPLFISGDEEGDGAGRARPEMS